MMRVRIGLVAVCWPVLVGTDWPQHLGEGRDGISEERVRIVAERAPVVRWSMKVGEGFAGPAVADGKVVVFHREEGREVVECVEAATGKRIWRLGHVAAYRDDFGMDEGPRATPVISHGRVFTLGATGSLHCRELETGKDVWMEETGAPKGFFGVASSPLLVPVSAKAKGLAEHRLIVHVGAGKNKSVVAFHPETGKPAWTAGDDEAGYASPTYIAKGEDTFILSLTRSHLHCLDPLIGRALWSIPFRSRQHASVNAATPVVVGERVFITASYETGAKAIRFSEDRPEVLWESDEALSSHYSTPVHYQGMLFGFHGRQEQAPSLRCVELETGKVKWEEERFGAGHLILAGGQLLILTERGELISAPASGEGFKPTARHQVLGFDTRAHPALAGGRLYARDKGRLVCLEVGE